MDNNTDIPWSAANIVARCDRQALRLNRSRTACLAKAGLDESHIRNMLKNASSPQLDTLEKMAYGFDYTLEQLLGFKPEITPDHHCDVRVLRAAIGLALGAMQDAGTEGPITETMANDLAVLIVPLYDTLQDGLASDENILDNPAALKMMRSQLKSSLAREERPTS